MAPGAQVRDTLRFVVSELRASDRLALVCYSTGVTVRLPLQPADAGGKQAALHAIERVAASGQTNLSGGVVEALRQLVHAPCPGVSPEHEAGEGARRTAAVLVLTDGMPTAGITDAPGLLAAAAAAHAAAEAAVGPTALYTFGYGGDHDSELLGAPWGVGAHRYEPI